MQKLKLFSLPFLLLLVISLYSCSNNEPMPVAPNDNSSMLLKNTDRDNPHHYRITVLATGLNNPRGLKFGPDGCLYVAEGGLAGDLSTAGLCDSVIPPVGPYVGGFTARILKINSRGNISVVSDQLPSSKAAVGFISGVADIEFVGNKLYALLAGAGCSHGIENIPNAIIKIHRNGSWSMVADLSTYQKTHPVAQPEEDDFEPDGTWYSMINVRGALYAVEPNHGEMVKVKLNGDIRRVIDFSAVYGHIVPTVVAYHGNFFVGNLNTFPVVPGSSEIIKVTPNGNSSVWATGFSAILGLVIDRHKRMYVLETSTVPGDPTPNTGKIVRVYPNGHKKVVVDSLFFPTGMTLGPDGALYVSNKGFGPPIPGFGEILRIQLNREHGHGDNDDVLTENDAELN